ncbi:MAG: hypothetical protein ACLPN5_11455 [Roseiarcus sp.]
MVNDNIESIVDRAIAYTEDILSRAPQHYRVARQGLETMRDNLRLGAEDHPALRRLEDYIEELDRRFAN